MFKDLLVEVDDSEICKKRIDYAIQLAKRFDAHLAGLYLIHSYTPPPEVGVYLTRDMEAQIFDGETKRADEALENFREAAKRADITFEARTDKGPSHDHAGLLSLHGRYADLVVIGQPDDKGSNSALDPGDVVLASGAPLMIVPHIGAPATTAERVLIAWNASRESGPAPSGTPCRSLSGLPPSTWCASSRRERPAAMAMFRAPT